MASSNPFHPNSVTQPTLFAGRQQQVDGILRKLTSVRSGQHASFFLHGERGIGKTALAKLIAHRATTKNKAFFDLNFTNSYYCVEKGQSLKNVLEASLNRITDELPTSILENIGKRLGPIFVNGKFTFGAFEAQVGIKGQAVSPAPQQTHLFKDQIVSSLNHLIQNTVLEKTDHARDGLLIVIDEIHNIKDLTGAGQILRNIITTLDVLNKGFFSFLLIGYTESIDKFFKGDPSARRSFDFLQLDTMPKNEACELLTKGFDVVEGLSYDTACLEKYITQAGGYPHVLQLLGYHLVDVDSDNNILEDDWKTATQIVTKELQRKDFSEFYAFNDKPTLREQIINCLARQDGPSNITKKELKNLVKGNIYNKSFLPRLIQNGAVKEHPNTGVLSLHSELFRSAVLMHLLSAHILNGK